MESAVPQPTYINLEYFFNAIAGWVMAIWNWITTPGLHSAIHFLMIFFTIFFFIIICYTIIRILEIQNHETHELYHIIAQKMQEEVTPISKNPKWSVVQEHIESENPSDWRLAIIEADAMLDELMLRIHPESDSLGTRLTAMESGDFATIHEARDAHGVRNRIAHEGSDFTLSYREARRVVGLYEHVFKEFNFI